MIRLTVLVILGLGVIPLAWCADPHGGDQVPSGPIQRVDAGWLARHNAVSSLLLHSFGQPGW